MFTPRDLLPYQNTSTVLCTDNEWCIDLYNYWLP